MSTRLAKYRNPAKWPKNFQLLFSNDQILLPLVPGKPWSPWSPLTP